MKKNTLDRINEAYTGKMGKEFSIKTRDRVNWIVNQVQGNKILDIGCSQGIIPIILGREGKKILGLDIAEESINFAIKELVEEHITVRENVTFKVSNFLTEQNLESDYDTILITEVLEHISDPYIFLKKANNHLKKNGRLIITVPFGINDYLDHKRTYYFLELFEHLSIDFLIEKIEYLGKWTGAICKKREKENQIKVIDFKRETIQKLEHAFYNVERELVSRVTDYQLKLREKDIFLKEFKEKYKQIVEENSREIIQYKDKIQQLKVEISILKNREMDYISEINKEQTKAESFSNLIRKSNKLENFEKKIDERFELLTKQLTDIFENNKIRSIDLKEEFNKSQEELFEVIQEENQNYFKKINTALQQITEKNEEYIDILEKNNSQLEVKLTNKESIIETLNKQITTLKGEFLKSLETEEKNLHKLMAEQDQKEYEENHVMNLEKKLTTLEKKYSALRNSKLGKLTLKYWFLRKKFFKK